MDYSNNVEEWDYSEEDISQKFLFFNVLKDGRIHVLAPHTPDHKLIPPSDDPITGVKIKDVRLSDDVAVRVFLPPSPRAGKTPVLLYVHGGGFCMMSAFSVEYTRFVANTVARSNVIAVSVEYGLFPTRPIPACYDDSWFALQWVASHGDVTLDAGSQDPWIKEYADVNRIYVGGDSAGGNVSHTLLVRAGKQGLPGGAKVEGMILIHPYFGEDDKMWMYMCPTNEGPRDPRMKPAPEDLARINCDRVLIFVAEKDVLKEAGTKYVQELEKSGWNGSVELIHNKEKDHCFHMANYLDTEALAIHEWIKSFIAISE